MALKPVWLDCDPGHDDALAIILAGYSPAVKLLGISTVAGNQTLDKVTRNALDILDVSGLNNVDVVAGCARPLLRPAPKLCPEIHGESGLDGPEGGRVMVHCSSKPVEGKAVNVMFECISAAYRQLRGACRIRLVCTGSLTNAAVLVTVYPEIVDMVEVVLMGGCMGVGNTGPVMEFNIQTDPEAAKVVFEAGWPLIMVPLEVTHTALATPAVLAALAGDSTTPFKTLVTRIITFFAETYRKVFKFQDPPLHDPCAVAYVIAPEIFEVEAMRVDIEVVSPLSPGQTVCDIWHQSGRAHNCLVAMKMDVDKFFALLVAAVHAADAVSPINTQGPAGLSLAATLMAEL